MKKTGDFKEHFDDHFLARTLLGFLHTIFEWTVIVSLVPRIRISKETDVQPVEIPANYNNLGDPVVSFVQGVGSYTQTPWPLSPPIPLHPKTGDPYAINI